MGAKVRRVDDDRRADHGVGDGHDGLDRGSFLFGHGRLHVLDESLFLILGDVVLHLEQRDLVVILNQGLV